MLAREIMNTEVITIGEHAKIFEFTKLLADYKVSGVPVCDDAGRVVGFVSEADLLSMTTGVLVKDIMSKEVIFVNADATLKEVAAVMHERRIKMVPVFEDGKLVGIISRADIVAAIAKT